MNKTEITWSVFIWNRVESGCGRIAGLKPVLRARIWKRVGVLAVSIVPSPIQNRPCFLPTPALMTTSPSRSWALGSYSGPRTCLAIDVYPSRRLWTDSLLYIEGGSSRLSATSDVAFPLWAKAYAMN